jgi:hypothetical protein
MIVSTGQTRAMGDQEARVEWSAEFARTVAAELRSGVQTGALTRGEADQLLSRLRVLVDQALEPAH